MWEPFWETYLLLWRQWCLVLRYYDHLKQWRQHCIPPSSDGADDRSRQLCPCIQLQFNKNHMLLVNNNLKRWTGLRKSLQIRPLSYISRPLSIILYYRNTENMDMNILLKNTSWPLPTIKNVKGTPCRRAGKRIRQMCTIDVSGADGENDVTCFCC